MYKIYCNNIIIFVGLLIDSGIKILLRHLNYDFHKATFMSSNVLKTTVIYIYLHILII